MEWWVSDRGFEVCDIDCIVRLFSGPAASEGEMMLVPAERES